LSFRVTFLHLVIQEQPMKNAITALGTLLLLATASVAQAQGSFTDLQTTLNEGDVVIITDDAGIQTRGTFERVGASIRLSVDGVAREWAPQQVREIRRRGDSLKNGLIIGLVSGGAAGAVLGWGVGVIFQAEGADPAGPVIGLLALGLGAGAGIGAGMDAAITGSTVVYRRTPRTVSVAPMLSPRAQGVRVALAF
jgi:hypothetical protein